MFKTALAGLVGLYTLNYDSTVFGLLTPTGLPKEITADGLEITFATNHIGPFLLTDLLLGQKTCRSLKSIWKWQIINICPSHYHADLLKKSAPARIVNVSSVNHWRGKVDFSHFKGENLTYVMDTVYNHTKLHNIIWTNELARRLKGTGKCQIVSRYI